MPAVPYPGPWPLARPVARLQDWIWLVKRHRRRVGTWPNPWRPRTYNDWIYRRLLVEPEPLHARLSCKLGQWAYKAERVGEAASLPLLGVWDSAEALARDWGALPGAFMLKPTHGSSWFRAVPDRAAADRAAILAEASGWLGRSYYRASREIGYRDVVPRLIAEPLLPPAPGCAAPLEYSLFCFDGRIALIMSRSRAPDGRKSRGYLDTQLQRLAITERVMRGTPHPPGPPEEAAWERMRSLAVPLSRGVDYLRLDFLVNGPTAWAGELTPYCGAGRGELEPAAWNDWLGAVWKATRAGRPWPDPPSGARPH